MPRPSRLRRPEENKTVRDTRRSVERDLGGTTEPDRDRPSWLRIERCAVDAMEIAGEVHHGLSEQATQNVDLLLLTRPTTAEVVTKRLVLDVVPPDAYAEP